MLLCVAIRLPVEGLFVCVVACVVQVEVICGSMGTALGSVGGFCVGTNEVGVAADSSRTAPRHTLPTSMPVHCWFLHPLHGREGEGGFCQRLELCVSVEQQARSQDSLAQTT